MQMGGARQKHNAEGGREAKKFKNHWSNPFSRAADVLTYASRWKPPCPSQQPFYALIFVSQRVLRSHVRLPQAFHAPTGNLVANGDATALQRYSAQPNAHLHGGMGVTKYKLIKKQNVTYYEQN